MRYYCGEVQLAEGHINEPDLDIRYPIATGPPGDVALGCINQSIRKLVCMMIEEQRQSWSEGMEPDITGTYEVKLNQDGLLSIWLENYGYPEHAAHGLTYAHCLTIDAATGYVYRFTDLFRAGSNYEEVLTDIVEVQIEERDVPLLGDYEGVTPGQEFYLTPEALVLYYQLYEITPYAYGFPQFAIPFRKIAGIVNMKGPIGRLIYGCPDPA